MSVERDQQDAQRFWCAVLDAIRGPACSIDPEMQPAAIAALDGDQVVDRVVSEVAEHVGPVVLIIDDLHELRSADALTQLERLLAILPSSARVVLSSRRDPPIRLHQLRLADEIAEIRAGDLRFTERETCELLAASEIRLSDAGVAALCQRTEGWAAGLRLAVISLSGHPDPERFVAEFSGTDRAIGEYLVAERHLSEGAALAQTIGRPYLEVACRAHQALPSKLVSVATARERGRQAVALAERHGLEERPILAPALAAVGGMAIWVGEFDEGERWLRRAREISEPHVDPPAAVLLCVATGMLHAGRGQHQSALEEFAAAAQAQSLLTGVHALAPRVTGWLAATQARLGMPDEARTTLAGFSAEPERMGAIHNARAVICMADGVPALALDALRGRGSWSSARRGVCRLRGAGPIGAPVLRRRRRPTRVVRPAAR